MSNPSGNEFEFINIFYTNFYFTDNEASLDALAKKLDVFLAK